MHVPELLQRLKHVKRNGKGWTARCPAHNDKNPSLSVSEERGRILLHCHAGCTVEGVCTALGMRTHDLFSDGDSASRIKAEYSYCDEQGKLLYQVIRCSPKTFHQRRPDDSSEWVWNLNGVRRVLYNLPEVLKAKSVLICEGEKDCESAQSLGLIATCNSGGAGKWREEYSATLRGKQVAIIADADDPGRKHAQQVASSLSSKADAR